MNGGCFRSFVRGQTPTSQLQSSSRSGLTRGNEHVCVLYEKRNGMMQTATKAQPEAAPQPITGEASLLEVPLEDSREWQAERLRLLWGRRKFFLQAAAIGLLASTLLAFLIPKSYTS